MMKRSACISVAAVMTILLAGCGDQGAKDAETQKEQELQQQQDREYHNETPGEGTLDQNQDQGAPPATTSPESSSPPDTSSPSGSLPQTQKAPPSGGSLSEAYNATRSAQPVTSLQNTAEKIGGAPATQVRPAPVQPAAEQAQAAQQSQQQGQFGQKLEQVEQSLKKAGQTLSETANETYQDVKSAF